MNVNIKVTLVPTRANMKISIAPARANMVVTFGSGANAVAYLETLVASIAQGPKGDKGDQGESIQGPPGPQGNPGETAVGNINFRGPYAPDIPYYHSDVNGDTDVVTSSIDGNTYYCLVDNTGNEPSTSPTYWVRFAIQGGRGEQGEKGDKGDRGEAGLNGESIPLGAVIMWAGQVDQVPTGYWMCNGEDVAGYGRVPDLRSRFIVGYDPRSTDYNAIGKFGGLLSVLLTAAQSGLRKHWHYIFKQSNENTKFLRDDKERTPITDGVSHYGDNNNMYAIQSSLQDANAGRSSEVPDASATDSHENRPPYYTLAFIIRVAPPAPTGLTVYQVSATDDSCDGVMNETTYINEGKSEFLIPADMDLAHDYTIYDGGVMVEPTINITTRIAKFDTVPLEYNGTKKNKITYKYYQL